MNGNSRVELTNDEWILIIASLVNGSDHNEYWRAELDQIVEDIQKQLKEQEE